jgi:hypothetical protein
MRPRRSHLFVQEQGARGLPGWWEGVQRCTVRVVKGHEFDQGKASLEALTTWWEGEGERTRNEATTRLHLIDELLVKILRWPKGEITAEDSRGRTYADYAVGQPATRVILEAKKEGEYFELPAGLESGVHMLATLTENSPAVADAAAQVLRYCQDRGVPVAVFSNGHQIVAFIAARFDGVPPLEGKALVFDSLKAMRDDFLTLWNALSPPGVDAGTLEATLVAPSVETPPEKLSARIPGYPGYWGRNQIQTELKTLGDLVLQDLVMAPELEREFLARCYLSSNTLSEYALVSKELLEARYSALEAMEAEVSASSAREAGEISGDLRVDITAASLGRRPLILLGDVGVGKSIFIRHFVQIDAKDVMEKSVVLSIDFGGEPALATDLRDYVMDRFVEQLRESYGIDVEADKFVRRVYEHDLQSFAQGVHSRLKTSNPDLYVEKEVGLLERKLAKRDRHLQASFRYITRSQKRQIVIFLDNIDQRDFDFQEQVFLIGQSLADTWPATVFLSLRPETFYRSRNVGSLTAYETRVFTIAPPSVGTVIRKRLDYCYELVDDAEQRARIMPEALDPQAELLARYLRVLRSSFARVDALLEFVENLAGGNVRQALRFLNTFVGSGHVDTRKILDIQSETGGYTVPLHEFVRAILYGDYRYYDPSASPIANVFEISRPDSREHFLLPLLLAHIERTGAVGQEEGFVEVDHLLAFGQSLGYTPSQVRFALRHATNRRLLQASPRVGEDLRQRYRITTVGAYTYKKLMGTFVYLDAVVVDTPIVDDDVAERLDDCQDIEDRVARSRIFVEYMDRSWERVASDEQAFDWPTTRELLQDDYTRIERTLAKTRLF